MRRLLLTLVLAMVAVCALAPGPAAAQTVSPLDKAVAAFRQGDHVYIDPGAELAGRVSQADAADIRARVKKGKRAVFVAVLPGSVTQEAGGDPNALPSLLHRRLGFAGTYAVLAGTSFRAFDWDVPSIDAGKVAADAFKEKSKDGVGPVLTTFVQRVEKGSGSSPAVPLVIAVIALIALAGVVYYTLRRRSAPSPKGK